MNTYIVSKITAVFFGTTTVIIFFMANAGTLFTYAGSIQAGVVIYIVNTAGLVVSLLVFIWLRAHRNQPKQLELKALEAYAALNSAESENDPPYFFVSPDDLREIRGGAIKTISSPLQGQLTTVKAGDKVQLRSPTEPSDDGVIVTILSTDGNLHNVRLLGD